MSQFASLHIELYHNICSYINDIGTLEALLQTCRYFHSCTKSIPALYVQHVSMQQLTRFSSLRELAVSDSSNFTKRHMLCIFSQMNGVKYLKLMNLNIISCQHDHNHNMFHLGTINSEQSKLTYLELDTVICSGIVLMNFCTIFSNTLKTVTLNAYFQLTDEHVKVLLENLGALESIKMSNIFSLLSLTLIAVKSDVLKTINFEKCPNLSEFSFQAAKKMPSVTSINFSYTNISTSTLHRMVDYFPKVSKIECRRCVKFVDGIEISSPSVTEIDFQLCNNVKSVSLNCPLLKHLLLTQCYSITELKLKSTAIDALDLSMLNLLRSLDIKCPNLKDINFSGCSRLKVNPNFHNFDLLESLHLECPLDMITTRRKVGGSGLFNQVDMIKTAEFHDDSVQNQPVYYDAKLLRKDMRRSASL